MLLVGFAGFFAIRVVLALVRSGPVLFADEAGYLGNARVLSGGIELAMGSSPFYRPGYSVLLAPLVGLGADPKTTYTLVLALNAALAASLLPLLYVMLRRCFDVASPAAFAGAIAGAAYPTVTGVSQVALSENVLFPLTVLWLLCVAWLVRTGDRGAAVAGLASGASAAALWIVHGRMIVALVVTAVTLLVLAGARRIAVGAAAAGLLALGAGLVVGRLLNDFVIDRNWDGRHADEIGSTLGSLDDLGGLVSVLRNAVGTSWYLLVATFGVVGLVLSRDRLTAATRERWDVATVSMTLLLTTGAGLIVVSAVWFVDITRADEIVYGRYVEPVAPPLLALGIVALVGRPPSRRTLALVLAAIAVLTLTVAAVRAGLDFPGEDANRWSVASLPFVTGDLTPPVLVGAGVVACAGACVLFTAARWDARAVIVLLLAMYTLVAAFTEVRLVLRGDDAVYPSGWTSPEESAGTAEGAVAFDTADFDRIAVKVYQWFLPHRHLEEFDSTRERPPARLFFSGPSQPRKEAGAAALWRDPGRPQVLWRGESSR
jgi:hypothetical protein